MTAIELFNPWNLLYLRIWGQKISGRIKEGRERYLFKNSGAVDRAGVVCMR